MYISYDMLYVPYVLCVGQPAECMPLLFRKKIGSKMHPRVFVFSRVRPFIMRSDSELLIFIFRSEQKMGLLMQTDFAKPDGIKSDLRIPWPKSSDFGPKSDDSTHRIIKSKNGFGL